MSGWTPFDDDLLREMLETKAASGVAWCEKWMVADLRWHAGQVRAHEATGSRKYMKRIPGYRKMAERWGVRPHVARAVMSSDWRVVKVEGSRSSRAVPAQSARSSRAVGTMDTTSSGTIPRSLDAESAQSVREIRDTRVLQKTQDRGQRTDKAETVQTEPQPPAFAPPAEPESDPLPPVPAWAIKAKPKGCTPRKLAEVVLLIASKVTRRQLEPEWAKACSWPHGEQGRPIKARSAKTLTAGVISLLRAQDWPDLDEWAVEATAVAWAFHRCQDPLFARDVRGEGWVGGKDRSRDMATFSVQERWDERVRVAVKAKEERETGPESTQGGSPTLRVVSGARDDSTASQGPSWASIAERLWTLYMSRPMGLRTKVAKVLGRDDLWNEWLEMSNEVVPALSISGLQSKDEPFRRRDYVKAAVPWLQQVLRGVA